LHGTGGVQSKACAYEYRRPTFILIELMQSCAAWQQWRLCLFVQPFANMSSYATCGK